jgi:hypothetical protein
MVVALPCLVTDIQAAAARSADQAVPLARRPTVTVAV